MIHLDWHVVVEGLAFPEGLRWHDDHLWFSDIFGGEVVRMSLTGGAEVVATVPGRPSGLGFRPDGTVLAVSMRDRSLVALSPGGPRLVADLSDLAAGDCNDMVVDPQGRAYVGNFGYDLLGGAERGPAALVMVDVDGTTTAVADDLWFPNGMILTPDGATLLVAETHGERITAFTVASDGTLSDRRVFSDMPGHRPDGIALDAHGSVWAPSPATGEIALVSADGAIRDVIPAPNGVAQACLLGGPDGHTLFAASSPTHDIDDARSRRGATIVAARVDVPAA